MTTSTAPPPRATKTKPTKKDVLDAKHLDGIEKLSRDEFGTLMAEFRRAATGPVRLSANAGTVSSHYAKLEHDADVGAWRDRILTEYLPHRGRLERMRLAIAERVRRLVGLRPTPGTAEHREQRRLENLRAYLAEVMALITAAENKLPALVPDELARRETSLRSVISALTAIDSSGLPAKTGATLDRILSDSRAELETIVSAAKSARWAELEALTRG